MVTVVVLGAGVSGHTAALTLRRKLGRDHRVIVVSPNSKWNWIPSNIWVGVDRMPSKRVVFPLAPVYKRKGVDFRQAKAVAIRPEGDEVDGEGAVDIVYTEKGREGEIERVRYDYLINATGPQLNFEATPGLGPDTGHTVSVCTPARARAPRSSTRSTSSTSCAAPECATSLRSCISPTRSSSVTSGWAAWSSTAAASG